MICFVIPNGTFTHFAGYRRNKFSDSRNFALGVIDRHTVYIAVDDPAAGAGKFAGFFRAFIAEKIFISNSIHLNTLQKYKKIAICINYL